MSRLPFDFSKMKGPEPAPPAPPPVAPVTPAAAAAAAPLSVAQIAGLIGQALSDRLPAGLRVIGEISNFSDRTHWYFRLKDEHAVLDSVMFQSAARKARFTPRDGDKVILTGRVEFYPKQGRTQFYAESIEAVGAGELERKLRELVEACRALGWLDPARKRALPTFPRRVAIVTSRTAAALQDVLVTMARRCPAVEATLVDVRVQGDGAAPQIARAIDWLSQHTARLGIDAVLVTRGGGSIEDLWAFNDREVARAIVSCSVPVVAAIGHETDTTLAELVADDRSATPTQAAMKLTPDRAALLEQLDQLGSRLRTGLLRGVQHRAERLRGLSRRPAIADARLLTRTARRRLDEAARCLRDASRAAIARSRVRVERASARLALVRPEAVYAARRARLADLSHRLAAAVRTRVQRADVAGLSTDLDRAWTLSLERRSARLSALERELAVTGPLAVLARGFSVTTDARGVAIRSPDQVAPGDALTTRVAGGTFVSIAGAHDDPSRTADDSAFSRPAGDAAPPRAAQPGKLPRRTRRAAPKPDGPGLFG